MVLTLTKEGFLVHSTDWSEDVALTLAKVEGITLTTAHWDILHFIRRYYETYQYLPNTRVFIKLIATEFGVEKGNSRYLQGLFPQSPLKKACKLAGLPKPPTCL